MDPSQIALLLLWLFTALWAQMSNGDLFSPTKILILVLGIYFIDILISSYEIEVYAIHAALMVFAMLFALLEGRFKLAGTNWSLPPRTSVPPPSGPVSAFGYALLWSLSAIPIGAQIYMFAIFGGVEGYVNAIGTRVLEWQGMGVLRVAIASFSTLNLLYFAFLLLQNQISKVSSILWIFHFTIFAALGLLSGSRSGLLAHFVFLLMLFHYIRRPIKLPAAIAAVVLTLAIASALEVARGGYKWTDDGLQTGLTEEAQFGTKWTAYGPMPISLVIEQGVQKPHLGVTFVTAITNFVPRTLWPTKPDTGGVVLTKEYTNNAWGGASYLATGILAESMINFGLELGLLTGIGILGVAMLLTLKLYAFLARHLSTAGPLKRALWLIGYIFVVYTVAHLPVGEFTNLFVGLTTKIFFLLVYGALIAAGMRVMRTTQRPTRRHHGLTRGSDSQRLSLSSHTSSAT